MWYLHVYAISAFVLWVLHVCTLYALNVMWVLHVNASLLQLLRIIFLKCYADLNSSCNLSTLQGQYKNDMLGLTFDNISPLLPPLSGEQILKEHFQIDLSWDKWWDNAMVFANIFVFRLVFFINIKLSEKVLPHLHTFYAKHTARWRTQKPSTKMTIPVISYD